MHFLKQTKPLKTTSTNLLTRLHGNAVSNTWKASALSLPLPGCFSWLPPPGGSFTSRALGTEKFFLHLFLSPEIFPLSFDHLSFSSPLLEEKPLPPPPPPKHHRWAETKNEANWSEFRSAARLARERGGASPQGPRPRAPPAASPSRPAPFPPAAPPGGSAPGSGLRGGRGVAAGRALASWRRAAP